MVDREPLEQKRDAFYKSAQYPPPLKIDCFPMEKSKDILYYLESVFKGVSAEEELIKYAQEELGRANVLEEKRNGRYKTDKDDSRSRE